MPTRRVIISVRDGAHARPVAELVRLAQDYDDSITLRTADGVEVDLSSVLAVMNLGLVHGDEVTLSTAKAPAADDVLDALAGVLGRQH